MPSSAAVELFVRIFAMVGTAVTAMRMYHFGLHRKYKYFFAYLIFFTLYGPTGFIVNVKSPLYMQIWFITEPVIWLFYVLVVLELYSLLLANHKGLYSLGRWIMHGSLALSVLFSAASIMMTPRRPHALFGWYVVAERGLAFSLSAFLLLALTCLMLLPIRLTRNLTLHSALFSAFFLSNTLGRLLVFGRVAISPAMNNAMMVVPAVCVLLWMLFLDEKGEEQKLRLPFLSREHEQRLITQLDTLNSTLLRSSQNK